MRKLVLGLVIGFLVTPLFNWFLFAVEGSGYSVPSEAVIFAHNIYEFSGTPEQFRTELRKFGQDNPDLRVVDITMLSGGKWWVAFLSKHELGNE